ncbi:uncharacterized protein LOC144343260, partial [Saccoglossus kowalevskii]
MMCKCSSHTLKTERHWHCTSCFSAWSKADVLVNHLKTCTGDIDCQDVTVSRSRQTKNEGSTKETARVTGKRDTKCLASIQFIPDQVDKDCSIEQCENTIESGPTSISGAPTAEATEAIGPKRKRVKLFKSDHEKAACSQCSMKMLKKNIKRHEQEIHGTTSHTVPSLKSYTVDEDNTLFAVRSGQPCALPVHVEKRILLPSPRMFCENDTCIQATTVAIHSSLPSFECQHLLSVHSAQPFSKQPSLDLESLDELVNKYHVFSVARKEDALSLKTKAESNGSTPVYPLFDNACSDRQLYFSVYTGETHFYSRLCRVIVSYDTKKHTWRCKCCKKRGCNHKTIARWFCYQAFPDKMQFGILEDDDNVDEADYQDEIIHSNNIAMSNSYPPPSQTSIKMVEYWMDCKQIPHLILESGLQDCSNTNRLIPTEQSCKVCESHPMLEAPMLITTNAKIVTMSGLVKFFLRSSITNHVAIGSFVSAWEDANKEHIPHDVVCKAYQHFEALTDHTYDFTCVICGSNPPVIITDLQKKACFQIDGDVESAIAALCDESDKVDVVKFWTNLQKEKLLNPLVRGLFKLFLDGEENAFKVKPSYSGWAPYIGHSTRGPSVFNTEHRKVLRDTNNLESECREMSEERLLEILYSPNITVAKVKDICATCKVSAKGSKLDMVMRIRKSLFKNDALMNKVFQKVWGASGGWLSASCPHKVVYALKFLIRAESPRDHVDLLMSFHKQPSVLIVDMAHMVARHGNSRKADLFHPNEGRVAAVTPENIKLSNDGLLKVHLPWLNTKPQPLPEDHSLLGDDVHLCLYDVFHQSNTSKEEEVLRR